MKYEIEKAYKAGKKAAEKYNSFDEAVMCSNDLDDWFVYPVETIALGLGFDGKELEYVNGWRYGDIPESGRSWNHMDDEYENGVSLIALDDEEKEGITSITEMFLKDRPVVRVGGYYSGRGIDGEPLVIGAEVIK